VRRAVLIIAGFLIVVVLVVVAIGYALPVDHVARREATFDQPPERVFAALEDVDRYPTWRSDVNSVEVLARSPAPRWREHGSNGTLTFEFQEVRSPARLVSRITDTSLPFGGKWTYELAPSGAGTRLAITEHGEVYNPVFRFMSRFVFGHTAAMEKFLRDLGAHLGKG